MNRPRRSRALRFSNLRACSLLFLLAIAAPDPALVEEMGEEALKAEVEIASWLELGPVGAPLPAFADQKGPKIESVSVSDLLATTAIDSFEPWPAAGDQVTWIGSGELEWTAGDGLLEEGEGPPRIAYLVAYVAADRFVEAELEVASGHLVRVFLDGEQVAEKTGADEKSGDSAVAEGKRGRKKKRARKNSETSEIGTVEAEIALTKGKHLLTIKTVRDPAGPAGWEISAKLSVATGKESAVSVDLSPRHALNISDLLDTPSISDVALSPDGELVAIRLQNPSVPAEGRESWVEVRRTGDGSLFRSYRGAQSISDFAWAVDGRRYSYTTHDEDGGTIWVGDLETGTVDPLLREVENLGGHEWSPDGSSLIYSVSVEEEADESGFKRLRNLRDRWTTWRTKNYLWQVSTVDGSRRRLTAGAHSSTLQDVNPDSSRLLFSQSVYTRTRPFSSGQLYELDLETLDATPLGENIFWLGSASYSPDGKKILFAAGPSVEGGLADEVPEAAIPNDYDTQLYVLDRESGEIEAITREFDPAVGTAAWSPVDGAIYLQANQKDLSKIFRYEPGSGEFEVIETGFEAVGRMDLASKARRLAFVGSSSTVPARVMALDLENGMPPSQVLTPGEEIFERVDFGEVEDWNFTTSEGNEIIGRIHYPPDFDPEKRYPLLMYYYGGTAPTTRGFGGRYPKNYWTANGYVVYIMQPSGATGFGQEFSTRHVNDWGKRVSREIIEGTEKFVADHAFIDPERIGCFGGSYGGFMTMLLISSSDLYAGAISHAGISSISSYWGEGWWGYLYSAQATAGSYPWNRPDIYVDQSPLFRADKIDTPLLLLHGDADPNVPPGESEQMYTALRVLEKEVEYVKISGEPHWILQYPHRKRWLQTIMAWFDRTLKGEPEFWEYLYPDGKTEKEESQ